MRKILGSLPLLFFFSFSYASNIQNPSGVTSVNTVTGPVTLAPGTNMTSITQSGQTITFNAATQSGGGGSSSLAVATGTIAGFTVPGTSPTAVLNGDSVYFTSTLEGGATAFFSVTPRISNVSADTTTIAGNLATETANVATSTNAIQTTLTAVAVSTNAINTTLTAVAVSTNALNSSTQTLCTLANGKVNYSSFSATDPIAYNSTTGALSLNKISLSTGVTGSLATTSIAAGSLASGVTLSYLVSASTGLIGTLAAAQFPALTGDITTAGGALATTAAATQANIKTFTASSVTVTNTFQASTGVFSQNGAIPLAGITNVPVNAVGNVNSFLQANVQNLSAGTAASSDFVATSNLGGNTSNYVNVGIQSSVDTAIGSYVTNTTAAYVYSSDHDLIVGAGLNGTDSTAQLIFVSSDTKAMTISSTGTIQTLGNVNISSGLFANGSTGSSGQFLKSQGAGTIPIWATPAGSGDVVTTATQTLSGSNTFSSTAAFTGSIYISSNVYLAGSQGSNGQVFTSSGPGLNPYWSTAGGGSAAGSSGQIQYTTNGTSFAGIPGSFVGSSSITLSSTSYVAVSSFVVTTGSATILATGGMSVNNATFTVNVATNMALTDNGFNFTVMPSTGYTFAADTTTVSGALNNIVPLAFAIGANENWNFEAEFAMTAAAAGSEFGLSAPTASTGTMIVSGNTSAVGTFSFNLVTALNTADTVVFATAAGTVLYVHLHGSVQTASTAGTVQLLWKSVTATQTSTIKAGSQFYAYRTK